LASIALVGFGHASIDRHDADGNYALDLGLTKCLYSNPHLHIESNSFPVANKTGKGLVKFFFKFFF
jgi:hypothetical protein